MTRKIPALDMDHIKELYLSGKTVNQVASIIGVSQALLEKRARNCGLRFSELRPPIRTVTRSDRMDLDVPEIVRLYESGISKHDIAIRFGVADMTISKRLTEAGYPTAPTQSEASKLKAMRETPEFREQYTKAAHDAVRGMKRSFNDRSKRAQGVEKAARITSRYEIGFADFLTQTDIAFTPQKAIGIYNCDFAVGSIAVELFGGCYHGVGRHAERLPERMRHILDSGWNIYIVWMLSKGKVLDFRMLSDFIAFNQQTRIDPTFRGQYRVIWSDGEFIASGGLNGNDFANVIPATMRHHPRRKNLRT